MQVQRDGDSRIPLSPYHLELKGEEIDIVITSVQDYYQPLKYSDAIDVLRGVGAIMRRKGYHEWETHVSDTWAELFYGKHFDKIGQSETIRDISKKVERHRGAAADMRSISDTRTRHLHPTFSPFTKLILRFSIPSPLSPKPAPSATTNAACLSTSNYILIPPARSAQRTTCFFAHHAVITRDPGSNQNSSSLQNTPINPSHIFRVWDYPDEACTGNSVEQLRQPRDRESSDTRGHGYDGISAIGLGNTSWAENAVYQGWDHDFHFPDAIFLDGVRYGSVGKTGYGNEIRFVKVDRTRRPDLPNEFSSRPWFNTRWEISENRNANRKGGE
ncbi:hypothetical protein G7Y79_00042g078220 [Physcia stellaris]|nr:hypothetical protein G7Y79_00042g078220 [Physcia stellaris]